VAAPVAAAPGGDVRVGGPGPLDPAWDVVAARSPHAPRLLDPGWVPADPPARSVVAAPATMPGPEPRARHSARSEVVVRRGDTLWTIVERHLGPHASAAEVAAEWPRWHAANHDVVGPDADVLLPGQRLRPPEPDERVRPPAPLPQTQGGRR